MQARLNGQGIAIAVAAVQSFLLAVLLVLSTPAAGDDSASLLGASSAPVPSQTAFFGKRDPVRVVLSADLRLYGKARACDLPDAILPGGAFSLRRCADPAIGPDGQKRPVLAAALSPYQPRAPPSVAT
ncbi:hypothetical protein J2858_003947 [Neorhizobium galegae]|uniref:hypothetical protein n=1 Tax=Neorhizobium galegae TaxID=399 RepID=UPI001AEA089C|nr:hypothetical protein [Neorhizobium galegae]MBP2551007.1 hypothetical protein [Neorhizobium galegae]